MSKSCNCSHEIADIVKDLRSPNQPPGDTLGLSEALATKLALDALETYDPTAFKIPTCPTHSKLSELPFVIFDDLDRRFFRGVLRKNVHFEWTTQLPRDIHGMTSVPGTKDARVRIALGVKYFQFFALEREFVIAALIHHMAHAYFLTCCSIRTEGGKPEGCSLGHGLGYCTLIHKIQEVLGRKGTPRLPDLFHCLTEAYRCVGVSRYGPSKLRKRPGTTGLIICSGLEKAFLDRSTCHPHLLSLQEIKPLEPNANIESHPVGP